jgi:hypothetical protein
MVTNTLVYCDTELNMFVNVQYRLLQLIISAKPVVSLFSPCGTCLLKCCVECRNFYCFDERHYAECHHCKTIN